MEWCLCSAVVAFVNRVVLVYDVVAQLDVVVLVYNIMAQLDGVLLVRSVVAQVDGVNACVRCPGPSGRCSACG